MKWVSLRLLLFGLPLALAACGPVRPGNVPPDAVSLQIGASPRDNVVWHRCEPLNDTAVSCTIWNASGSIRESGAFVVLDGRPIPSADELREIETSRTNAGPDYVQLKNRRVLVPADRAASLEKVLRERVRFEQIGVVNGEAIYLRSEFIGQGLYATVTRNHDPCYSDIEADYRLSGPNDQFFYRVAITSLDLYPWPGVRDTDSHPFAFDSRVIRLPRRPWPIAVTVHRLGRDAWATFRDTDEGRSLRTPDREPNQICYSQ